MKHFVILSSGAYSSYSPIYFMSDNLLTKEELDKKGIEVGDKLFEEFDKNPERPTKSTWESNKGRLEKYSIMNGETLYPPNGDEFIEIMEKWLVEEKGFKKIPNDLPEINVSYGELPNSHNIKTYE